MTKATRVIPQLTDEELERFWSHVDKKGAKECWNWKLKGRWHGGYGKFSIKCKPYRAHVISYVVSKGSTNGLFVRHSCHNPLCVNPRHLKLGTPKDNMDDKVRAGRQSRGSKHASKIPVKRGENNVNSKLSDKERAEMVSLYLTGRYTQLELAEKFNVKQCTVSKSVRKHLGTFESSTTRKKERSSD